MSKWKLKFFMQIILLRLIVTDTVKFYKSFIHSLIHSLINSLINSITHSFNQLFITTKTTVAWHITKVNFLGPLKDITSMLTSLAQMVVQQAMNPRVMGLNPASNNRFMSLLLNPEAFCMPVG